MKSNKKILFLILISIISFSLTGCFDGVKKVTNIPKSEKEKEISLGTWNENVYSNSFFDIKYTMPDGWSKLSDDDLAKLMDLSFDAYKDMDDYAKEVAKQITIYHFSTNNPNTGDNVQLLSESTIMDLTEEYYVDTLSEEFSKMEAVKYEVMEKSEEKIGKYSYKTILLKAVDYDIYQKVYVRKSGKYFISILITSNTGIETLGEIVKSFE